MKVVEKIVFVGIMLLTGGVFLVINTRTVAELDESKESYSKIYQAYTDEVSDHSGTLALVDALTSDLEEVNLALETALTETELVRTLLNKDMSEWTSAEILQMRQELVSLPYGSPFLDGHIVTGAWGSRELTGTFWKDGHLGVDLIPRSGNMREPIISPIDGKVITWGRNDRVYGNYLVIETLDGKYQLKFTHLSAIGIVDGTNVALEEDLHFKAGQQIARMGQTGKVTGPHLHLEYYIFEENGWRILDASAISEYIGSTIIKEDLEHEV